ncbi:TonB-dependent receptor [Sphingomonas sp. HDW15A]|uniref:TonB-dependent receptor n=1 Tax=Sphingomonas sp. HDW15A TaxID=2714942 RepID=UPI00140C33E4|nr:TonB-dependent receptor [Sphingomonas sp. HDW15A]QIK95342.1 TonB-dependent receptor [Sphingomonas sp. HDW15A]
MIPLFFLVAQAVETPEVISQPGQAPAQSQNADRADQHARERHDVGEAIVVTGVRRSSQDVLGGVSVVSGSELVRERRQSLGETLAGQPGVSATSFGPAASRPILRGLSGDRIRLLTDGIGSFDVSSSSADHEVTINPMTAERIEVLRGPAALLFGSSAIGGVVNVIDTRIPRRMPDDLVHADLAATYGSAANERSLGGAVDIPLGSTFVLHGDASFTKTDNLRTGGNLLSDDLREQAAASPEPEIRELADLEGKLPNTDSETKEVAGGIAYVGPNGLNIGASISHRDSYYGVPIRFSLDPDVEAEAPHIDARQTRYDARATVPLEGFLKEMRLRGGYSRYRHDEVEDTGEVASTFRSNGGEIRLDAEQSVREGWSGTTGAQFVGRDVSIRGEEKFLPDSRQRQLGLFTLQMLERDPWRFEAGARVEFSKLTADEDVDLDTPDLKRKFTTVSGSLGGSYEFSPGWRAGLSLSRSARSPAIDELFANGPHAGTQAFEIGDPDLDPETSIGIEASLRKVTGPIKLGLNLYHNRFSDFIYQSATGEIEDDLPVYLYRQGKARFTGVEAEIDARLGTAAGISWAFEGVADAVHGKISGFGPAPQIPPLRLKGALTGQRGNVDGRFEVEHAFAQKRNAPLETETPAYTLVNAALEWHPDLQRADLTLGIAANNLFDVVARRHSSLLKDYAPLAGRDIRLTLSVGL